MKTRLVRIWQWKADAEYWHLKRECYREDKDDWLKILRQEEPGAVFKATNRRPVKSPNI